MTENITNGTAQGLIEYLDNLVNKGRATSGSIVPLKSTLKQVLSVVDGENDWKNIIIKDLNIEDYIERFKNKTNGKYAPQSYRVYSSRLNKIKEWYVKFLANPGWAPKLEPTGRLQRTIIKNDSENPIQKQAQKSEPNKNITTPNILENLITYPFPLRNGKIVYLSLPADLNKEEADRLSSFLVAIATPKNS